ncbi:MAG: PKD domain-containing protein [Gammaproteobacteria bacterium]
MQTYAYDARCSTAAYAGDICCSVNPPAFCPAEANGQTWNVRHSSTQSALSDYLENAGFPNSASSNPMYNRLSDQTAEFVVAHGQHFLDKLDGSTAPAQQVTLDDFLPLLSGREQLTTLIVGSVQSIAQIQLGQTLEPDTIYPIPFMAGPQIKQACIDTPTIHKDRNFNLGLMNVIEGNGDLVFQATVGVPTELAAKRPSWLTRQARIHKWIWWTGDANMLPISSEDISSAYHVYRVIGNYTTAFVMLESEIEWMIDFDSEDSEEGFSIGDLNINIDFEGPLSPDACNYAEMRVRPNLAPTARAGVGADPITLGRYRFDASASGDPNGNPLTYTWQFSDGSVEHGRLAYRTYPQWDTGNKQVTLTVSDGGLSDTTVLNYHVAAPCGGIGQPMCF